MVDQIVRIGELEVDTGNISPAELDKLKMMLPEVEKYGKTGLSQLDIILEAIQYIKTLENSLRR